MASHLISEQRADKTGKVVTRHVLAAPRQTAKKAAMPAPSLGKPASKTGITSSGFKPRTKQLEQTRRTGVSQPCDPELERTGTTGQNSHYYAFTASDADVYAVLGVTGNWGDAIKLINEGVRTAEDAHNYLSTYKLERLATGSPELVDEALRRNVSTDDFVAHINVFSEPHHDPGNRIDSVRFAAGPLLTTNQEIARDIGSGKISYEDIRKIGISKLKPWGRLKALRGMLHKLNDGTAECTADDLKEMISNVSAQRVEAHYIDNIVKLIESSGYEVVKESPNILRCAIAQSVAESNAVRGSIKPDDIAASAVYALKVTNAVAEPGSDSVYVTEDYFNAGIPIDIAITSFENNGDIESAKRMHDAINENGINGNLADGWL